jgi:hypothetical protein
MSSRKGTKELISEFKGLNSEDINSIIGFFERNLDSINHIDANKGGYRLDFKL